MKSFASEWSSPWSFTSSSFLLGCKQGHVLVGRCRIRGRYLVRGGILVLFGALDGLGFRLFARGFRSCFHFSFGRGQRSLEPEILFHVRGHTAREFSIQFLGSPRETQ